MIENIGDANSIQKNLDNPTTRNEDVKDEKSDIEISKAVTTYEKNDEVLSIIPKEKHINDKLKKDIELIIQDAVGYCRTMYSAESQSGKNNGKYMIILIRQNKISLWSFKFFNFILDIILNVIKSEDEDSESNDEVH